MDMGGCAATVSASATTRRNTSNATALKTSFMCVGRTARRVACAALRSLGHGSVTQIERDGSGQLGIARPIRPKVVLEDTPAQIKVV